MQTTKKMPTSASSFKVVKAKKAKSRPQSKEEFRARLPKKLNKLGEWLVENFVPNEQREDYTAAELRAILK